MIVRCDYFVFMMVPSPHQYPSNVVKVCNLFLPARDNNPHRLCTSCRGKTCNIGNRCEDCHDWMDELWHYVDKYRTKLCLQQDREKERRVKATSSYSFWIFSLNAFAFMPVSSSYDNTVVTSVVSSSTCAVTFTASSSVVSAAPFVHLSGGVSGDPITSAVGKILLRQLRRWRCGRSSK